MGNEAQEVEGTQEQEAQQSSEVQETMNFDVVTDEAATLNLLSKSENNESESASTPTDESNQNDSQPPHNTNSKQDQSNDPPAQNASANTNQRRVGRAQKRIDRLTARMRAAERENAELRARLEPDQSKSTKGNAESQEPSDSAQIQEPDENDYESWEEYLDAMADYRSASKQAQQQTQKKAAQNDEDRERQRYSQAVDDAKDDMSESFDDARQRYADFDEKIGADGVPFTEEVVIALAETDNPGELAYHLANNREELHRIATLSPRAQAMAIGRLEAKMAGKPAAAKAANKKTTNAPDPFDPLKGSDVSQKSLADMDFAEYDQAMNQREKGRKGFW